MVKSYNKGSRKIAFRRATNAVNVGEILGELGCNFTHGENEI